MGQLLYGHQAASFEIEDRTLAHVEAVILAKLRRNENFALTLESESGGRDTIWLQHAATLRFTYSTERPHSQSRLARCADRHRQLARRYAGRRRALAQRRQPRQTSSTRAIRNTVHP